MNLLQLYDMTELCQLLPEEQNGNKKCPTIVKGTDRTDGLRVGNIDINVKQRMRAEKQPFVEIGGSNG